MADHQPSGAGINTNFAHADPESNVGPAGAPQTSLGNAQGTIPDSTAGSVLGQAHSDRQNPAGDTVAGTGTGSDNITQVDDLASDSASDASSDAAADDAAGTKGTR